MTSVERNGSFESAGLKRTRLKNVKDDNLDGFDDATKSVKNWIEVTLLNASDAPIFQYQCSP